MDDISAIPKSWWTAPKESLLFSVLGTARGGLTDAEASARHIRFGPNELEATRRVSFVSRLAGKLVNPLVLLLLGAAALSAALGQVSDFVIIVTMTLMSVVVDTLQEHHASDAAERLKKRVSLTASVVRGGVERELPLREIVPGDVVRLSAGDIVPADLRLWESNELLVDQSALTGESFPQRKDADGATPTSDSPADILNSAFMGTYVVSGEGVGVAVMTGKRTSLGAISKSLTQRRPKTDFEIGISRFGYLLLSVSTVFTVGVFVFHILLSHDIMGSLLFVLALAIGFAPELLPIVISINLSKGAIRMSQKGVIVKYLPAIESFGSMDVLCTDKTGTLTENSIDLVRYENCDGKPDSDVFALGYLSTWFQTSIRGPLEKAILDERRLPVSGYKKLDELPFDFFRKRVSVMLRHPGGTLMVTKGAPEAMIALSNFTRTAGHSKVMDAEDRTRLLSRYAELSSAGYRVIGVAAKSFAVQPKRLSAEDERSGMDFIGFLAFLDPPKRTAKAALSGVAGRGIAVKVLTGDNRDVTETVAREVGLPSADVLSGEQVDAMDENQLLAAVDRATLFVRMNPESKRRVIGALRKKGHVVGFMGDGINDAPALAAADIGISVDRASDVAKETADIILLRKDLHVLLDGVVEGRKTFGNVMKYILMGLSSNFGNMASLAVVSVFIPFLPMLPTQILLNDLLYDASQLMLAGDRVDERYLNKPRRWDIRSIARFMLVFGPISSVFDILTFALLLRLFHATPALFQTGWFLESIVTQTLVIFSIRTSVVPFFKSRPAPAFAAAILAVVCIAIALPLSPVGPMFGFVRPPTAFFVLMGAIVVWYFIAVESAKRWFIARI